MKVFIRFETRFGDRHAQYFGLLIIGRDHHLGHPREQRRWQWRSKKVMVNSLLVRFVTYDKLYGDLSGLLRRLDQPRGSNGPTS